MVSLDLGVEGSFGSLRECRCTGRRSRSRRVEGGKVEVRVEGSGDGDEDGRRGGAGLVFEANGVGEGSIGVM